MSTDLDSSESNRNKLPFKWPTKCICNLCDCGSHSCYTYSLEDTSDFRCKYKQTKGMNQFGDGEDQFGGGDQSKRQSCANFSNDERYLSSMATDLTRLKRSTPQSMSKMDDDENDLLHVLVSKPEIAAKPRDNIVFEGDMDLKTTFETSYEALAKMRLDYWKKYQEQQQQQEHDKDTPASKASRSGGGNSSKQAVNEQRQPPTSMNDPQLEEYQDQISCADGKQTRQKERLVGGDNSSSVSVVSTGKQRLMKKNDIENEPLKKGSSKIVDSRQAVSVVDRAAQLEPPRRSPKLADDDSKVNVSSGEKERKTSRKLVKRQADNDNEIEMVKNNDFNIETSVPEQQLRSNKSINKALPTNTNNNNNYQDTSNTSTYIDPDLSPIIIYDANMNRLEKVGIRKRSKYRPSTSLRSGAHGLFGDQKEEKVVLARNLEGQQFGPSMASAGLPNVRSFKTNSPDSLNARNLNNLKQSTNLTYSDQNLIVDSKRKLKDNINMVDHIREHDIVGRSTPISPQPSMLPDQNDISAQDATAQMMRDDMENLKLAQLEEDAAVEEIQRVTSNSNDQTYKEQSNSYNNQHQQQQQQQHGRTSSTNSQELRDSSSSRHSKLQRTCQNQNFYLFENEYPEARASLETGVQNNRDSAKFVRISPHSRFYNNLFRESPDFILTTGKFTKGEAKSSVAATSKPARGNQFQDNNDRENSAAATSGNDYDYDYSGGVAYGDDDDDTNDVRMKFGKQQRAKNDGSRINNDPYNNSDNILDSNTARDSRQLEMSNKNDECRVCKLNEDYQYVGSQSGHKYFVEKQ